MDQGIDCGIALDIPITLALGDHGESGTMFGPLDVSSPR
jgi:hypothetical protein